MSQSLEDSPLLITLDLTAVLNGSRFHSVPITKWSEQAWCWQKWGQEEQALTRGSYKDRCIYSAKWTVEASSVAAHPEEPMAPLLVALVTVSMATPICSCQRSRTAPALMHCMVLRYGLRNVSPHTRQSRRASIVLNDPRPPLSIIVIIF